MGSFFVQQGNLMSRDFALNVPGVSHPVTLHIPSASMSLFNTLSIIVLIPVYDKIVVSVPAGVSAGVSSERGSAGVREWVSGLRTRPPPARPLWAAACVCVRQRAPTAGGQARWPCVCGVRRGGREASWLRGRGGQ
jgi:hypothetical protein